MAPITYPKPPLPPLHTHSIHTNRWFTFGGPPIAIGASGAAQVPRVPCALARCAFFLPVVPRCRAAALRAAQSANGRESPGSPRDSNVRARASSRRALGALIAVGARGVAPKASSDRPV